jgi:hypothetical protein
LRGGPLAIHRLDVCCLSCAAVRGGGGGGGVCSLRIAVHTRWCNSGGWSVCRVPAGHIPACSDAAPHLYPLHPLGTWFHCCCCFCCALGRPAVAIALDRARTQGCMRSKTCHMHTMTSVDQQLTQLCALLRPWGLGTIAPDQIPWLRGLSSVSSSCHCNAYCLRVNLPAACNTTMNEIACS